MTFYLIKLLVNKIIGIKSYKKREKLKLFFINKDERRNNLR